MKHVSVIAAAAGWTILIAAFSLPVACHRITPTAPPAARTEPADQPDAKDLRRLARVDRKWTITTTSHCTIRSRNARLNELLARRAEHTLDRIAADFMDPNDLPGTIQIIVHPTRPAYVAAATRDGADPSTPARAEVERDDDGAITELRLILTQRTPDGRFDTRLVDRLLPHEMCHLLLTAHFGSRHAPLYLQEGLAMSYEAHDHAAATVDAGLAVENGTALPLERLMAATRYPDGREMPFCAQSYSFVGYLRQQMTAPQFRAFLAELKAGQNSPDALHRVLRIAHNEQLIARLERTWSDDAVRRAALAAALAPSPPTP
jgi:hypothetical protein